MPAEFKTGASERVTPSDFNARVARLRDPMADYTKPLNGRRSSSRKQARPAEDEPEAEPAKDADADGETEGAEGSEDSED